MTIYGYARVSTDGQTLAVQEAQLHAAGCAKIYSEKVSGSQTDRAELAKLLTRLEEGDVLVVTRLDRLARSTRDLLNILDTVARSSAGFRSLADAWADTTTPHGRLILTVLGGLAEFERELIGARTSEGRKRAMTRGVKFGSTGQALNLELRLAWDPYGNLFACLRRHAVRNPMRERVAMHWSNPIRNDRLHLRCGRATIWPLDRRWSFVLAAH